MKGKIIKSIAGFYEVHTGDCVYRCRAKGIFRALGKKPLVGDDVEIDITDTVSVPKEGNVRALLPRKNELVRPNVANVDQALLIFAITHPAPSYNMLDRFLITMQERALDAVLCFTKKDLATQEEMQELRETYEACGCRVLFISSFMPESLGEVQAVLAGKTTVLTGPSGAGKSTLINTLCPDANMQTGELSRKIHRGKNTTRHVELLAVDERSGSRILNRTSCTIIIRNLKSMSPPAALTAASTSTNRTARSRPPWAGERSAASVTETTARSMKTCGPENLCTAGNRRSIAIMKYLKTLLGGILAGISISIGGTVFLSLDDKVLGAVFFTVGLFTVCTFGFDLFTGKVCYVFERDRDYAVGLPVMWAGNFAGAWLTATAERLTRVGPALQEKAASMCAVKAGDSLLSLFILGILCDILIYIAVDGFNKNPHEVGKYLSLFFGVTVFILCGTEHCVADMYYFSVAGMWNGRTLLCLLVITLGNAFGGVLLPLMRKLR